MYPEFGKLYDVDEALEMPELFHIHTYDDLKFVWRIELNLLTSNFPQRTFSKNTISEIFIRDRENAFEKIRYEEFETYPSRLNCLFAIEFNQMSFWINRLRNKSDKFQIVRLKLKRGKVINLDDCFFDRPSQFKDSELAKKYWEGKEICANSHLPVYLFEGEFVITEIIVG